MSTPDQPSPDPDKLQKALEACCDVLIILQSIDPEVDATKSEAAHRHLAHAIRAVRHAIEELRLARSPKPSIVGLGFVMPADPSESSGEEAADRQVSPRRTA